MAKKAPKAKGVSTKHVGVHREGSQVKRESVSKKGRQPAVGRAAVPDKSTAVGRLLAAAQERLARRNK